MGAGGEADHRVSGIRVQSLSGAEVRVAGLEFDFCGLVFICFLFFVIWLGSRHKKKGPPNRTALFFNEAYLFRYDHLFGLHETSCLQGIEINPCIQVVGFERIVMFTRGHHALPDFHNLSSGKVGNRE